LRGPQQFWLKFQGDITDLIKKARASVRNFESALLLEERAIEGALFMLEQFAFQQP
jgi:hypothetical protein